MVATPSPNRKSPRSRRKKSNAKSPTSNTALKKRKIDLETKPKSPKPPKRNNDDEREQKMDTPKKNPVVVPKAATKAVAKSATTSSKTTRRIKIGLHDSEDVILPTTQMKEVVEIDDESEEENDPPKRTDLTPKRSKTLAKGKAVGPKRIESIDDSSNGESESEEEKGRTRKRTNSTPKKSKPPVRKKRAVKVTETVDDSSSNDDSEEEMTVGEIRKRMVLKTKKSKPPVKKKQVAKVIESEEEEEDYKIDSPSSASSFDPDDDDFAISPRDKKKQTGRKRLTPTKVSPKKKRGLLKETSSPASARKKTPPESPRQNTSDDESSVSSVSITSNIKSQKKTPASRSKPLLSKKNAEKSTPLSSNTKKAKTPPSRSKRRLESPRGKKRRTPSPDKITSSVPSSIPSSAAKMLQTEDDDIGDFDLVIPLSLISGTDPSCTVLVQIEPEDATVLDFEGSNGAIGRFEADEESVKLDFKGYQYSGEIRAGPTAMIVSLLPRAGFGATKTATARIEAITDEFVTLNQTQNSMAKLDATLLGGEMDESYYDHNDVDVNARERNQPTNDKDTEEKQSKSSKKVFGVKRKNSVKSPLPKKRKMNPKKK